MLYDIALICTDVRDMAEKKQLRVVKWPLCLRNSFDFVLHFNSLVFRGKIPFPSFNDHNIFTQQVGRWFKRVCFGLGLSCWRHAYVATSLCMFMNIPDHISLFWVKKMSAVTSFYNHISIEEREGETWSEWNMSYYGETSISWFRADESVNGFHKNWEFKINTATECQQSIFLFMFIWLFLRLASIIVLLIINPHKTTKSRGKEGR